MEAIGGAELKCGGRAVGVHLKVDEAGADSVGKLFWSISAGIFEVWEFGGIVDTDGENSGVKYAGRLGDKNDVAGIFSALDFVVQLPGDDVSATGVPEKMDAQPACTRFQFEAREQSVIVEG